jgi:hypothetical protein
LGGVAQRLDSTPSEGNFNPAEWKSTMPWEEAIYRRAMCYRIIDMMVGQFFPPTHSIIPALGINPARWVTYGGFFPYAGPRWSYHNPVFGDVWESCVPPFPGEDVPIVKDGVTLAWDGSPKDRTVRVSEASSVVTPVEKARYLDAGGYNGDANSNPAGAGASENFDPQGPAYVAPVPTSPFIAPIIFAAAQNYHPDASVPETAPNPPPSSTPAPSPAGTVSPAPRISRAAFLYG